jgi:hypothetical protein
MAWAGARLDAFQRFEADFGAVRIPLAFNFRSSPGLVRIQHVVARALDANAIAGVAQAAQLVDGDVAQIWNSQTRGGEAEYLTQWLADDMAHRGRSPRDYALLVRQKSDDYEAELSEPLASARPGPTQVLVLHRVFTGAAHKRPEVPDEMRQKPSGPTTLFGIMPRSTTWPTSGRVLEPATDARAGAI